MELGEGPKLWAMDQSEQVQITMFVLTLFDWEVTGEPDVTHETAEVLYIGQDTGDPRNANLWDPETTVTRVWSRHVKVVYEGPQGVLNCCRPPKPCCYAPKTPTSGASLTSHSNFLFPKASDISDVICFPV